MDRLRRKLAVIRSAVTRAINEFQALLSSSDATAGELTENLNILELKEAALKAVDSEIQDGVDIDHLEEERESVEAYQVLICRLRTRATLKLDALRTPNIISNAAERLQVWDQGHQQSRTIVIKLSRLQNRKFEGYLHNKKPFWDQFEGFIHHKPDLSSIDKFRYLTSYLFGKAEDSIRGLPIMESNCNIAVDILKDRFVQTQAIIDDHKTRLLNLRRITTSIDVMALRRLNDDITINVRNLKAHGLKVEEYSALLHAAEKKRLPDDLVLRYRQQTATDIADSTGCLQTFLNFLKSRVESRERGLEINPNQVNLSKA
ncbi:uncharacterized protein LOC120849874 [Ixodes scapularis]|uniref:uncharacterized protein LOC120849874 n=1 Tax=Ixodes scapularis TaxID=6945 RepID=UPI001C37F1E2|nr:uncharacterized protein LOC120849874 [Ixodes scapularis]